jgi:hypothetical protein
MLCDVHRHASVLLRGVLTLCLACWWSTADVAAQVSASSAVYIRSDTDQTTVVTPRLSLSAPVLDATRLDVVYTADVWTSASIDIRSSASKAVTEQRDEIDVAVSHELSDLRVTGAYRFSYEPDYESHGAALAGSLDLARKSTTLDVRLAASLDQVGRAGEPSFQRALRNASARFGLTQLLDTETFVQVVYEVMSASGYNSSPYRFAGIGTFDGRCRGAAFYCIPEANPSERLRHAFVLNARRALGEHLSAGISYRFYLDDWAIRSHTASGDVSFSPTEQLLLALRYRFYSQSAASHYGSSFSVSDSERQYFSNDKELATFVSHRVALELEKSVDYAGSELSFIATVAPSRFLYADFRPVPRIDVLELTLAARFTP